MQSTLPARSNASEGTIGDLARNATATFSLAAGAIHLLVTKEHFDESVVFGLFFMVVAWLQLLWAALVLTRPSRLIYLVGAVGSGALVALWAISRTVGVPVGPDAGEPEPVATADLLAVGFEGAVVAGCVALMRTRLSRLRVAPGVVSAVTLALAFLLMPLTAASLLAGAGRPAPHDAPSTRPSGAPVQAAGGRGSAPSQHRVDVRDDAFAPRKLRIAPGDTVIWENKGANIHTVTSEANEFDSGDLAAGDTFRHVFKKPGAYLYYCKYHGAPGRSGMWGVIIVAKKGQQVSIAPSAASGAQAASAPGSATVVVGDDSFSPNELRVAPGDTVVWEQRGSSTHTVTSDTGAFDSGELAPGSSFSHTFTEEGVYYYHCTLHGAPGRVGMSGVIIVAQDATAAPAVKPATTGGSVPAAGPIPTGPGTHRVEARDGDTFSPQRLTIRRGDKVVWVNRDTSSHTVTSDTGTFDSGTLNPGESFSRTFTKTGTYYYHCRFHGDPRGGMWGVIVVTSRTAPARDQPGAPAPPGDGQPRRDNSGPGNAEDRQSERDEELNKARRRCREEKRESREDGDAEDLAEARRRCREELRRARSS